MTTQAEHKVIEVAGVHYVENMKPCPFCGFDQPILKQRDKGGNTIYSYLSCRNDKCVLMQTRAHRDPEVIMRRWNTRRCVEIVVPKCSHCPEYERRINGYVDEVEKLVKHIQIHAPQSIGAPAKKSGFVAWLKNFFLGE